MANNAAHEFHIRTNDGWVVTLVTDKPIDLGTIAMSSIIVQPADEHEKRIATSAPEVMHTEYHLVPTQRY